MFGPLHGFKVIDLTSMVSGPLAMQTLVDRGADGRCSPSVRRSNIPNSKPLIVEWDHPAHTARQQAS